MGNSLHIATMAVALAAFAATPSFAAPTTTPGLPAFQDDAAFHAYLKELLRQAEARRKRETARFAPKPGVVPPPPASPPAPVALQSPGTVGGNSTHSRRRRIDQNTAAPTKAICAASAKSPGARTTC